MHHEKGDCVAPQQRQDSALEICTAGTGEPPSSGVAGRGCLPQGYALQSGVFC